MTSETAKRSEGRAGKAARNTLNTGRPNATDSLAFRILAPLTVGVVLILAWQIAVQVTNPLPSVLPSPLRVWQAAMQNADILWSNTLPTLQVAVWGLVFSLLVSVVLASGLAFVPWLRNTMLPILIVAQSIPIIVIAPLFVIWFGFGIEPKIALIVIASTFPMTLTMLQGLLSADPDAMVLMKSMGASRMKIFWRLQVPTALPYFFTGVRLVASFAVLAAIFAETVGAVAGLGIYMTIEKSLLRTDLVLAAAVISIVLGLVLFFATYLVEAIAMPWERRRKAMRSE